MSALFTINFRREAYLREVARVRRRMIMLGVWVAYFGVLGVILGLYGLNCSSFQRRVIAAERQAERLQAGGATRTKWKLEPPELAEVQRYAFNPRVWRDRLARLSVLLPSNVSITSLAMNPEKATAGVDQNKLVITGVIRGTQGQDPMGSVMSLVSSLHADSAFASGYETIRLARSNTSVETANVAEFVIECR